MSLMEIVLLVVGAGLFIASFFISDKEPEMTKTIQKQTLAEINRLVDEKMNQVKGHIDDVVDEAVSYSMEKTERSLERITNEKIMAVSEYSDTVLSEIHRNHEEAMFLYDMLNDKHTNLKDTMSKASRAAKEITDTAKEAEAVVNTMHRLSANQNDLSDSKLSEVVSTPTEEKQDIIEREIQQDNDETEFNNKNEKVLELYKQGRSPVAVAKELEMGVGEVRLILDLFSKSDSNA